MAFSPLFLSCGVPVSRFTSDGDNESVPLLSQLQTLAIAWNLRHCITK